MAIVFLRTVIVYTALLAAMRLLGKRQLGEMELSEFVVAALMADMAAHPLQDIGIPLLNGLIPVLTLFCLELLISAASLKSIRLRRLLFGRPSILIAHGQIDQRQMRSNRFTLDELMEELRSQNVTDLSAIDCAVLETNGQLNVILRAAHSPVTPAMLGLAPPEGGRPVTVISDGRLLEENLLSTGHDRAWLREQLAGQGLREPEQVFLMTVDEAGGVYCAAKEGQP